MLVGLTGYAGSGKDAAAAGLVASGWQRVSFAEPIRQILLTLNPYITGEQRLSDILGPTFSWAEAKVTYPEIRRLLQVMGTEVGREMIDDDLWVNLAKKTWDDCFDNNYNVVVTDVRFLNEARAIRCVGGKLIRIHREGCNPANNHVSDTSVDLISPDHEIVNNGTIEDLQNTLKILLGV